MGSLPAGLLCASCERPHCCPEADNRDELAPVHFQSCSGCPQHERKQVFGTKQSDVRFGSWSCENALAEAPTSGDFGGVAVFGHLAVFDDLFFLERLLCDDYTRIAVSSGWTPPRCS